MSAILPTLLTQGGLIFELVGALVLATPGLTMTSLRKGFLGYALRIPDIFAWLLAFLVTVAAIVSAPLLLLYGWTPVFVWVISLIVAICWVPATVKSVLPGVAEAGRRPTDDERDRVQSAGITLLAIGFAAQGLAATLV